MNKLGLDGDGGLLRLLSNANVRPLADNSPYKHERHNKCARSTIACTKVKTTQKDKNVCADSAQLPPESQMFVSSQTARITIRNKQRKKTSYN